MSYYRRGSDTLLGALRTPLAAVALALLVTSVWAPLLFEAATPRSAGHGVVQETALDPEGVVVRLDDGSFTLVDVEAEPGDRIEVFTSPAMLPSGSDSLVDAWFVTGFASLLGTAAAFCVVVVVGNLLLGALQSRSRRTAAADVDDFCDPF